MKIDGLSAHGISLRPFEPSDAKAFVEAIHESAASVGKIMPWATSSYSEANALGWFEHCRIQIEREASYDLGIFASESGRLLGGCALNQLNRTHNFCNIGYWVRQSAQRQGVAHRTVQVLAKYAFEVLKFNRAEIVMATDNLASEGVARKAGAEFEGRAKNRLAILGKPVNAKVYALTP